MAAGKLSREAVESALEERDIVPGRALASASPDSVRAAAVNLRFTCYKKLGQLVEDLLEPLTAAGEGKAQLVCFPQYVGMLPLTLLSVYDEMEEELENAILSADEAALRQLGELYAKNCSEMVFDCYYHLFSRLARRFRVYIQAGTVVVRSKRGLVNRAYLFGPDGEPALVQNKIYPNKVERLLGIVGGEEMLSADTRLGRLSILIGEDNRYFETARWAAAQGSKIFLSPVGGETFGELAWYEAGLPMRVQENKAYGIQSAMFYNLFPSKGRGLGGFYGPYQLSPGRDGVLSQVREEGVLLSYLNLEKLSRLVDVYTGDKNPIVDRSLAELYQKKIQPPRE